jgi:hypothetical protein
MKRYHLHKFLGIISLVVFVMLAVSVCDDGTKPEETPSFAVAKGKLTINGLGSFNDKYVYVQGLAGSSVLVGLTDITGYPTNIAYKLVRISSGKAEVPLYMANPSASSYSDSYISYNGNDTISSISIIILSDSSLSASNVATVITNNLGKKTLTSGTFSNGNLTMNWGAIIGPSDGSNPIQLAENQWTNGNIPTSGGEQWFTFTATSSTQYIHFTFGTLTSLYMQIYDSNGGTVGISRFVSYSSMSKYASQSVTSGQIYYIKVWPYSGNGTYKIVFSTSSGGIWPPSNANPLTVNQWANGNISSSITEQWFTFTATASKLYIHYYFDTLTNFGVEIFDSNGIWVEGFGSAGSQGSHYHELSASLMSGNMYYIKVSYTLMYGTYRIAFNTSSTPPTL